MNIHHIPISFDCICAATLRDKNIRTTAYPFDWNVKNLKSIINIIDDNFTDLFDEKYLIISKKNILSKI